MSAGGRLYVIDGTAQLFRSYYGGPPQKAPDGREIGGLGRFAGYLPRFLRSVEGRYVAVVFDTREPTFRHEAFPAYKANRGDVPADLLDQLARAPRLAERLGFRCFARAGFEADDLMATLAHRGRRAGLGVTLVTPDKDVLQLVGDGVLVYDPRTRELLDGDGVTARMGVPPELVVDCLALAGDASDNVPGVRGVGPRTARGLINELGGLDSLYSRLDEVPSLPLRGAGALAQRLEQGRESAFLSRELVRLRHDVPLEPETLTLGDFRYRGPGDAASAITES